METNNPDDGKRGMTSSEACSTELGGRWCSVLWEFLRVGRPANVLGQTQKTAKKLHNKNDVETSIQWIPGHCDIPGNGRADNLARQGNSKTQHDEQVSYVTSNQIVQTKSRKIWHDRWAGGNIGRIYYQHQQTPNQTDPINQLHRAHQTAVFRLRTHHEPLNAHLHRIKKEHPAKCVYCSDSDETVEHVLLHCTTTSDPDYCQLNQIYTTRYMDPLHNCNEQPPTICQPRTDVARLSEVWGTKKGKKRLR